ncbi:hypothetical protein [Methanosphaera sp. BMS]|uniref:hypothetical protein n=1 Tax=Methanosphaera sp. BMS TaxID=1789762 RepID=UPI000DC1E10B|nr:hypothetical protein [Methanosphaera sp. BMS]AWX33221.1 hypothetical protein AW729_09035 [Methanosphaera sp. BMS]
MKFKNKKTLKINRENDIESIIENFQQYEKKYNIKICELDKGIQYEVKNMKIAQTYKSTILETDINNLTKKLKDKGKISIVIIDNIRDKEKNHMIDKKINRINRLDNVNTRIVDENNRYDILETIIEGG